MPVRKTSLPFNKISGLWWWLFVHLSIPLLLLISIFLSGPVHINTNFFDMLPRSVRSRELMEADMILGERNGREITILSAAPDFQKAKEGAALLYAEFEDSPDFEKSSLYFDAQVMAEFIRYLYDYRFVIAGRETIALLESGRAEEIAQDALASAFSAFNFVPLDNIEYDPFFLTERRVRELLLPSSEGFSSPLSGGSLNLKEDVLTAEKDGTWYVLIRMTLASHAVSVGSNKNAVGKVYAAASSVKESIPDLEFYFSGIPFHSYESSSGAQREISSISTVTLIIVLLLFLIVFRSPLPVLFSILAAGFSLGLASATALLVFREIHIITFVFGTTLIGTCVDYSVHFFVHWKGNVFLKDGFGIRSCIAKSIVMCFISTEICFSVFLFSPFSIMKQFAVFSMVGIFSSLLTSFCIYPRLKIPDNGKRRFHFFGEKLFLRVGNFSLPRAAKPVIVIAMVVAALAVLVSNFSMVKIKNDLSSLYTMSASLMESEKRAAMVLDYGSPGWYFIVTGSSPEKTLEHEEYLIGRLEEEVAKGNLQSIFGTLVFVPSIKTQRETHEAMKALLPLVSAQFENLGFPPEYEGPFYKEFNAAEYCLPENAPSHAGLSNLWIGENNGNYYSCVLPLHPAVGEDVFRSIADEFDSVYFINKGKDIGHDLDTLTKSMILLFLSAYIAISVLVCFRYPWRDSLKICAAPPFLVLVTLSVLAAAKIPLGFFSVAALVLVFGLGMDYIFFCMRGGSILSSFAVVLSFLTTLLSFGALALSSFAPVHIFGLTVCAGLSAAFIFAMLLRGEHDE